MPKFTKTKGFSLRSDRESLFKYKSPVKDVTIVEPQSTEGFVDTDVMENVGELEGKGAAGDSLGLQVLQQLDVPKKEEKDDEEDENGDEDAWSWFRKYPNKSISRRSRRGGFLVSALVDAIIYGVAVPIMAAQSVVSGKGIAGTFEEIKKEINRYRGTGLS